jgi:hypothetical protein
VDLLLEDRRVGRAAPNREVVARDDDGPPVDAGPAHDEVRRREARELTVVVLGPSSERADLVEASGIDERVDALAHGELARLVLAGDFVAAAHRRGELGASPQLVELRIPRHKTMFLFVAVASSGFAATVGKAAGAAGAP